MEKLSEELLLALAVKNSGGGGGGTNNYEDLNNLPQINGVTLSGDKSASDLSLASLDANGKVPSSQLPSYVDDVVEGYYDASTDRFYEDSTFETVITPVEGKSWVDIPANKSYRWTGSVYVRVDEGVQIGETSDTAYAGNKGKANADAIAAIKDGQTIDSFADVETALSGKQSTLTFDNVPTENSTNPVKSGGVYFALSAKEDAFTAGDYLKLTNGTLSVQKSKGDDLYAYKFITTSTADVRPSVKIQRYINGVFQSETNYINDDVRDHPVTLDDLLTLSYGIGGYYWQYTLLENSNQHNKNDVVRWEYRTVVDYEETFDVPQQDTSKNLVLQEDLTSALALKQNATDNNLGTDAKTIVGAINEHEGDVDSLKSGLTNLDNEVNGDATTYPYADVITINDAVPANLADCSVKVEPVQDLHGYDKPWVGGAGKNKLPMTVDSIKAANTSGTWNGNNYTYNSAVFTIQTDDDGNITGIKVNGTPFSDTYFYFGNINFNGSYKVSGYQDSIHSRITVFVNNSIVSNIDNDDAPYSLAVTSSDTVNISIKLLASWTFTNNIVCPIVCLSTETDATFAPYTNICPISGHTKAVVTRCGINVWDEQWELGDYSESGEAMTDNQRLRSKSTNYIRIVPPSGYIKVGDGTVSSYVYFYDKNKLFLSSTTANGAFSIPQNATCMRFCLQKTYGTTYHNDIIVALGSDTVAYQPYKGQQYTLALGDTIYGGTVDFDSGVMRVTHGIIMLKDLSWSYLSQNTRFIASISGAKIVDASTIADISCEICKTVSWGDYGQANYDCICLANISGTNYVGLKCFSCESVEDLLVVLDNYKMTYPIATPFTVQLTPQQIQLLQGTNTLYASTGQISVTVNGVSGAIGSMQEQVNELESGLDAVKSRLIASSESTGTTRSKLNYLYTAWQGLTDEEKRRSYLVAGANTKYNITNLYYGIFNNTAYSNSDGSLLSRTAELNSSVSSSVIVEIKDTGTTITDKSSNETTTIWHLYV